MNILMIMLLILFSPLIMLILFIRCIIYIFLFIYQYFYFKSEDFLEIKKDISKYTDDCNELNEHINELKKDSGVYKANQHGEAKAFDGGVFNTNRKEAKKSENVYYCSLPVLRNAENNPFEYLCKYFNIDKNEENLNKFEEMLNNFNAIEEGKKLLINKKEEILKGYKFPFIIRTFCKNKLDEKLGFTPVDLNTIYFPTYSFMYLSGGGYVERMVNITLDLKNLEDFVKYLSDHIKWRKSVAGQRALMTQNLRTEIKERDEYTCQSCHNSINKEPNLLLEIDHIVPLSKGGMSTKDNLQTLCWRCNRSKGSKLIGGNNN